VIEILTFKLLERTADQAFLEADRAVQTEFIPNQPGFLRRTTARGPEGEWLVITLWSDVRAAQSSWERAASAPVVERFFGHIERSSVSSKRYETLD